MKKKVKVFIGVIGLCLFIFQSANSATSKDPEYPAKPITFYIHVSPGGGTDVSVRAIMEPAGKYLGQPFIPINKPGGAQLISNMTVMSSKPDGYTIGTTAGSTVLILPHTEECPYKDLSAFTLIMNYGKYMWPLIVRSDAPWKTWKEFIEWARQNPRAAKIGITGGRAQTPMGIALWQVEQREKVEFTYITYKGGSEVLSAVLGGHVTLDSTTMDPPRVQYLKEGKLRILAYTGAEKIPGYENMPSFPELYGFEPPNLMGAWGPKGIPEYILEKLEDAFAKAVRDPDFVNVMNRMYMPIVYMNRAELNKYVREMFPRVGEIMKILRVEEAKGKK